MEEWINPRYAELVAAFRRQQDGDTDAPLLALSPNDAPGPGRGFITAGSAAPE
jgi:hypothetical protein